LSADARFRFRPTGAVIDLSALTRNYRRLRERAGRIEIFPVVKSDGYGHGAVAVARRLEEEGADRFAVASAEEGIALRRGGIAGQILILGFSDHHDAPVWRNYGLIPSLYDIAQARAIAGAVRGSSERQPVHLKLDTGMGRLGISPGELADMIALLRESPGLELAGTFTQLARAQEPGSPATDRQIETMRGCLAALSAAGLDPGLVHVANSAAVLLHPSSLFQAFRPGLALYGVLPSEEIDPNGWEPVMTVEIQAPVEYAGDLMGDLNGRRGRIQGMDTKGATQFIRAQAPMAEMLNYQNDLTAMTQGRASFTMEFDHYDFVPQLQADKIIAAAKAAKTGEEEEEE